MNPIAGFPMDGTVGEAAGSLGAASQAIAQLGSLSSAASMQADSILRSLQGSLSQSSPGQAAPAQSTPSPGPSAGVSAASIESLLRGGLNWLTNLLGGAAGGAAGEGLAAEAVQLALPLAI